MREEGGSFKSTPLRKTQHTRKHAYTQIHKNYIFILIQTCTKESKHKTNRYTSNHYSIRAHTTVAMWLTAALILTLLAGSSIAMANLPLEMLTSMASFSMHEGEKKIINTNPRYKFFSQTHFTAGDIDQFSQYRDGSNGDLDASHPFDARHSSDSQSPTSSLPKGLAWSKYKDLDVSAVDNTFKYL